MASHQFLRQQLPHTLEKRQAVVVVVVEVADGGNRGVAGRDGDGQRGDIRQPAILEGALENRALVKSVLSRQALDLEVVQHS